VDSKNPQAKPVLTEPDTQSGALRQYRKAARESKTPRAARLTLELIA